MSQKKIIDRFVNADAALKLKALGFDEPVMARYHKGQFTRNFLGHNLYNHNSGAISKEYVSAPTHAQTFAWFRSLGIFHKIHKNGDAFTYEIYGDGVYSLLHATEYPEYEIAEAECIKALIKFIYVRKNN